MRQLNVLRETIVYYAYQFSDIRGNFEFLDPNLPKNGLWSRNFKNLSLDSEWASLRYYVYHFSGIRDNIEFWTQICPKMDFGVEILKIKVWIRNQYLQYTMCANFQSKGTFLNFLAKICGNCPIMCNILVQILLRVLQRAGWRLKWAGWRWVELGGGWNELGGGGWSWVELGARFGNTQILKFPVL